MLITIYDKVGNPKVELSPNDSSTQVSEIQGDSVLTLSFTHYEHIDLDVDDYADFEGERYWLTEKYRPKQKSTKEWSYDIKLYGVESMIKRLLVIKTVDNEDEPVFTLTAPPREHVSMIVKCMNDGMGNITDWKVGQVDGAENIVIDYFGKYCDEALKEIAEKVGAEWWVEGQTVNICKCEHGEPVELGYNKGLLSIDPGTADNVKFYTRLYPVGSSRNIDREKYGFTRLQLPGGQKYVEINADKYGRVDHFEQSAFEGIYPRRVGSVSSVRSEVKTGEDGNPFTIYYFTDNSLPFDPNDYMIGGLVIRVSFQEGSELAGLGEEDNGTYFFEVNFNSSTREFEIITIWPYDNDIQLPGDKLIPKVGDKYILWNLRMPDEYYTLAEEELLTAVNQYNADHNLDISVYKAPTDHVWIEDNAVELTIGRRVRLESEEYFPGFGFRDSRITKITRKVNLPSSMDIEISDALSRTSQEKMADSIDNVLSYAQSIEKSISFPDIIRTGDKTLFTDNNLLSARRSQREFLNKNRQDSANEKIIFKKGFEVGDYIAGASGGIFGIDLTTNDTVAEVARLYVRVKAYFEQLNIINSSVLAGKQYITPGGGIKCTSVAEKGLVPRAKCLMAEDGSFMLLEGGGKILLEGDPILVDNGIPEDVFRCYFLSEQDGEKTNAAFIVGDQAISEMFNAKTGTSNKISNHRYWRLVTDVNNDAYVDENGNHYGYIDLSKTICEPGSSIPKVGDDICQLGYQGSLHPERQNAMIFSTVDADSPSIKLLNGINAFSLDGKTIIAFGVDPITHKVYFRLGSTGAKQYLEYTQENGLKVAGAISSESTYDDGSNNDKTLGDIFKELGDVKVGGENLLLNSDFINGFDHWSNWREGVAVSETRTHGGRRSVRFLIQDLTEDKYYGLVQDAAGDNGNKALYLSGEYPIAFSAWVFRGNVALNDDAQFYLDLKFCNSSGIVIDTQLFNLDPGVSAVWTNVSHVFYPPAATDYVKVSIYLRRNGYYFLSSPKLEKGNVPTDWSASSEDISFIKRAMKGSTTISGGTVLSSMLLLGEQVDYDFKIWSGMSGLYSRTDPNGGMAFFAGGSPMESGRQPTYAVYHNGTGYAANKIIKFNAYDITVGDYVSLNRNGLETYNEDGEVRLQIGNMPVPKTLSGDVQTVDNVGFTDTKAASLRYVPQYTDADGFIWNPRLFFTSEITGEQTIVSSVAETSSTVIKATTQISGISNIESITAILAEVEYTLYRQDSMGVKTIIGQARRNLTLSGGVLKSEALFNADLDEGCTYSAEYKISPTNTGAIPTGQGTAISTQAVTEFDGRVYTGKDVRVILGNDGFLSQWPATKLLHHEGMFGVVVNNNGFRISPEGFEYSTDGGASWNKLNLGLIEQ